MTEASFFERYRRVLVAAAIVAVVAVVGAGLVSSVTQPAYACSTVWVPDPTTAPSEGAAPQPGYVQPDMGQGHVATGTQIRYTYCPPASGRHFNAAGAGPIRAQMYGPEDAVIPQGWLHNLEHGALVILYRDPAADQTALKALFDAVPTSPVCGFEPGGQSPGPVVARFKDMAWPYAAFVWDRVLPMETLDQQAVLDFYAAFGERTNPEELCPGARESASPSASAAPSGSPAPSAGESATPSVSTAPSESVAPSSSASASPS